MEKYSFQKQFKKGQKYERFLDNYFSENFTIKPATREEERRGIDRHFQEKKNGRRFTIQYKADKTAGKTGNAFVETVSVDTNNTPGWVFTCEADFIIYYVVDSGPAYVVRPGELRKRVDRWQRQYPEWSIPNRHYNTLGILVPLDEFERLAYTVVNI